VVCRAHRGGVIAASRARVDEPCPRPAAPRARDAPCSSPLDANAARPRPPPLCCSCVRRCETALAFYETKNRADHAITGVATYNVQPPRAGLYFNKASTRNRKNRRFDRRARE